MCRTVKKVVTGIDQWINDRLGLETLLPDSRDSKVRQSLEV